MGRVLSLSSQTVYGPVGNSAAVPALQEMGHEVMALPTVVLSNHPGHGKPVGQVTPAALLAQMLQTLDRLGAFKGLDAVMTGYFANPGQVIAAAQQIESLVTLNQGLHVLVDPVIGDHGRLYVDQSVAEAIRDHLLPLATITTPNAFELAWLSGEADVVTAASRLAVAEVIATSIPLQDEDLATQLHGGGQVLAQHQSRKLDKVPNGTGDFLAGCYLARRLAMEARPAFASTMARLDTAVARSAGSASLKLTAG